MINVEIAKVCGLCAGCKYAIDTALKIKNEGKNAVLFKEIVHNKNVNLMLQDHGIPIKDEICQIQNDDYIIIRAHGEPPETFEYLKSHDIDFADCTCVNVKKIHNEIEKYSNMGFTIFLIGKYGKTTGKIHPEILGSKGYSKTETILIEDEEDLSKAKEIKDKNCLITFQTTFNESKARNLQIKLQNILDRNNCKVRVYDSICSAQKSINKFSADLARQCDLMIVVGGKNSSNTKELFENVKKITNAIFLEDIYDYQTELKSNNVDLSKNIKIGLTAGASTNRSELETLKILLEKDIENLQ